MRFLLNEGLLNVTTFIYCCLGFFLALNPLYFLSDIDSVAGTFHVFVNTYFLIFRLALLIVLRALVHLIQLAIFNNFLVFNFSFFKFENNSFFPGQPKYSLLIFDVVLHYQLNVFKIPKMVQYNHRSLMISVNDAKYIPLQCKCKLIHLLPIYRTFQSFSFAS